MSDLVSRLRMYANESGGEQLEQRVYDLEQAATDPKYAKHNPLGGPARMFDVIADRIRAGEDYHAVLKDYGLKLDKARGA